MKRFCSNIFISQVVFWSLCYLWHDPSILISTHRQLSNESPFLGVMALLTLVLTAWFQVAMFKIIFCYFFKIIQKDLQVIDKLNRKGNTSWWVWILYCFSNNIITKLISKVKSYLLIHKNFITKASSTLGALLLTCVIALPMNASYATDEKETVESRLENTIKILSDDIANLVSLDVSMRLLIMIYGSIVVDVMENPISFERLHEINDADKLVDMLSDGFSFDLISNITSKKEVDEKEKGEKGYSYLPDSYMGFVCMMFSWLFTILIFLSAFIRTILQIGTGFEQILKGDTQAGLKIAMQSSSAALAIFVTMPVNAGYSVLNLLFISSLTTGIGTTNFSMMGYFTTFSVSVGAEQAVDAKASDLYEKIASMAICNVYSNGSKGGVSADEITRQVSMGSSSNFLPNYSAGIHNKSVDLAERDYILDFKSCGKLRLSPLAQTIDVFDNLTPEQKLAIDEVLRAGFKEAIEEFTLSIVENVTLSRKYLQEEQYIVEKCIETNGEAYDEEFDESLDCPNTLRELPSASDYINESGLSSLILRGQVNYSRKINDTLSRAFYISKGYIKDLEAQKKAIAQTFDLEEDGEATVSKLEMLNADGIEVSSPSTYGEYSRGWLFFNTYYASRRIQFESVPLLMTFSATWDAKPSAVTSTLEEDIKMGEFIMAYYSYHAQLNKGIFNIGEMSELTTGIEFEFPADEEAGSEKAISFVKSVFKWLSENFSNVSGTISNEILEMTVAWIFNSKNDPMLSMQDFGHFLMTTSIILNAANSTVENRLDLLNSKVEDGLETNDKKRKKSNGIGSSALKKAVSKNLIGAVVMTVAKPFMVIIGYLKDYGYYVGVVMGYGIPFIPTWFFVLAVLKYLSEVVTTTILISMAAGKIYNPDGTNIVSSEMASIIKLIMLVSATPLMIITLLSIAYQIHAPAIGVIQAIVYESFYELNKPYLLGVGYISVSLGLLLVLSTIALVYLFSMPLQIQQSAHAFLNTGMNVGDPNDSLRGFGNVAVINTSMKSLSKAQSDNTPTPTPTPTSTPTQQTPKNVSSSSVDQTNALPSAGQGNHHA